MTGRDADSDVWGLPNGSEISFWLTDDGTWGAQWVSASELSAVLITRRAVSREAAEAAAVEWLRENGLCRPLSPAPRGEP